MGNKKLLQTLCLGAAVLSAGVPAEAEQTSPFSYDGGSDYNYGNMTADLNINNSTLYTNNGNDYAAVRVSVDTNNFPLNLAGNVKINVSGANDFALYTKGNGSEYNWATINVNPDRNKTVQIIGDVKSQNFGEINLNLNNAASYFAGKIISEGNGKVYLNLSNKATWYVPGYYNDNALIAGYYDQGSSSDVSTLDLRGGGILDFYHKAPKLTDRKNADDDKRTINITGYKGTSLDGATFRIKSNINAGWADTINLQGDGSTADQTYYVQVAYDPSVTASEVVNAANYTLEVEAQQEQIASLAVVDAKNLTGTVTVTAKDYTQDVDGGLNKLTITPTIKEGTEDGIGGDAKVWYLTGLKAVGIPESSTPSGGGSNNPSGGNPSDSGSDNPSGEGSETNPGSGSETSGGDSGNTSGSIGTGGSGSSSGENTNTGNGQGTAMKMAESAALASTSVLAAVRADNNDLMRRMGDLRNCNDEAGFWLRYYTGEADVNAGPRSELKYKSMQGGYDRQYRLGNGRLFAGVTVSHTDGDFGYTNGGGESDTTLFGIYGSYLGDKGHFADFILKYGHLSSDFSSVNDMGDIYRGSMSPKVLSMSAEYGYHKALSHNWYIEPQAELTYGYIGSDDYTMSLNGGQGAYVENDSVNSLIGRLGFTLGQKTERGSVYAKLSLVKEFAGDMDLRASYKDARADYSQSMKDTWIEYGFGFNAKIRPDLNLYGEFEKSTGDVVENKWRANVGLRYVF